MTNSGYFINKDSKTGEIVYLEYNKDGYKVKPKAKKKDAIEVNKIVFVSPTLTEKLIKKKIDSKISKLLLELNTTYDDEEDSGEARYRSKYKEAEILKKNIISIYTKYLGKNYVGLTLKKLQIIIDAYKSKINDINMKNQRRLFMGTFLNMNNFEEKKGKGR